MARDPKDVRLFHERTYIKASDLGILHANISLAKRNPDIGFEHANVTWRRFTKRIDRRVKISLTDLESALWSCTELNRIGEFYHPDGKNIEEFIEGLEQKGTFNYEYNFFM